MLFVLVTLFVAGYCHFYVIFFVVHLRWILLSHNTPCTNGLTTITNIWANVRMTERDLSIFSYWKLNILQQSWDLWLGIHCMRQLHHWIYCHFFFGLPMHTHGIIAWKNSNTMDAHIQHQFKVNAVSLSNFPLVAFHCVQYRLRAVFRFHLYLPSFVSLCLFSSFYF